MPSIPFLTALCLSFPFLLYHTTPFLTRYLHEHGLGHPVDFHLAKRHYDRALAADAKAMVPVTLALWRVWAKQQWRVCLGGDDDGGGGSSSSGNGGGDTGAASASTSAKGKSPVKQGTTATPSSSSSLMASASAALGDWSLWQWGRLRDTLGLTGVVQTGEDALLLVCSVALVAVIYERARGGFDQRGGELF
jgi:hypothetical protein